MPSENRAPKSSNSSKPTKSKNDIAASAHKAKDAMSQNTTQAYGALMGCFGGEKKFNEVIQKYNPAFFDYAENVVLKSAPIEYKASKLFVTLGVIGMFQFAIPIVHWPLEVIAKFLQFSFLYTCGAKELRKGFSTSSSVNLVKSLLITFVVVVSLQTIPSLLFDIHYHFGALWHFCLPVLLLSLPSPQENDRTVAIFLCDVFLSSFLNTMTATMTGMLPEIDLQDDAQRVPALFAFSAFAISLWLGLLRETTAYLLIWGSILLSTVNVISQEQVQKQKDSAGYYNQMTVWHNLLAIWLWGFLISTIESFAIPGLVSSKDLILYHLPSYFLWVTLFILAMMLTKKTEKSHVADTWYARWLRGSS